MKKDQTGRIPEIDIARGIAVVLMIFDHAMFDLAELFPAIFNDYHIRMSSLHSLAVRYWNWDLHRVMHFVVVFVFLALTGICCSFSRNNLKRGLRLLAVALALTGVTWLIGSAIDSMDTVLITFGVLHCIAVTLIVVGMLESFRIPKEVYLILGILLTGVGAWIMIAGNVRFVLFGYESTASMIARQILGTIECGGDSFPLPLNGGQILIGVYLGKLLYRDRTSLFPNHPYRNHPITFFGRNSLLVYFAHQIIIPVLGSGIFLLLGCHLAL